MIDCSAIRLRAFTLVELLVVIVNRQSTALTIWTPIAIMWIIVWLSHSATAMTPEQVAIYFPVAHSARDESRRNVKYDLEKPDGWKRFVATSVQPILDTGVKTIQLHNPGGHKLTEKNMRFRQFSLAQEEGFDFINDFTEAFKPIVDSGVRVIAYVGSPDDMDRLRGEAWQKAPPEELAGLPQLVVREFRHIRAAGVCLGLDNVTTKGPESLSWWIANEEQARGRRPVVEMTARNDARHWWGPGFDQLALFRTFSPRHMEGTSRSFVRDYPQLGGGDWYAGTTFVLFRQIVNFKTGKLEGQKFSLWRDATPVVGWWNAIRRRDSVNKIVPMMHPDVFQRLVKQDLLKELAN